ncbi:HupE/UreJ family protein [Oharaeibacter diazotrophicus]|uniref:Urease accessory protein n=1 Tax=Oharaeibacter diazotrophicus TaxID=1920512 RepID=A0A4R6RK66_9HYPH|nr:HupE/UreJ family protein [Oharaeibacter diazotrophicus]TDP86979.1 urease accessory protein [Oharaeibacter diazotrophicus]BBE71078.1 HupE / UreJ protein [Pleomorphomonas sp. SM30]GLS77829.1 protein hupE [Oharaeibacter diazotrophicus]
MRFAFRRTALAAGLALAPTAALAHVGVGAHDHAGLAAGFLHPVSGLDHVAAMVAVGLWAATLGGRAMLAVPAAFVGVLSLGAVLGVAGVALPAVEPMIAASVVVLGLLTAFAVRVPAAAAAALVGFLGLFHGYAHGAEMPEMASPALYGLGFVTATVLLHAAGLGLGLVLPRLSLVAARGLGAVVAAIGVMLVAG